METLNDNDVNTKIEARKRTLNKNEQFIVLLLMPTVMLIMAFFYDTPSGLIKGLNAIRLSNDVLLADYLVIAGTGATLLNASLVTLINIAILKKMDMKPNGIIIASLFLLMGFSFMGKNIFNIWPFYIGGYIYSKVHNIEYKNVIIVCMLATTMAPLSSVLVVSLSSNYIISLAGTLAIGSFLGFIMPAVSSQILMAHSGYNIYNMGYAGGFVSILVFAILRTLNIEFERNSVVLETMDYGLLGFLVLFFLLFISLGFVFNGFSFSGYKKLLGRTGRLVTDMTRLDGFALTLVNMGSLGIISIIYVIVMGGVLNGPVIAGILTVVGFAAFGKHIKNSVPILVGVAVASFFIAKDASTTDILISALFGTALAPIVGEYGMIYGIVLGFLHLSLTLNLGVLHGGIHLYNNGLSGGIIATIFVPMLDALKKEKKDALRE